MRRFTPARVLTGLIVPLFALGCAAMGASPGNAAMGKQDFETNCSVCHNADTTETKMGPGLKGLFKKAAMANKKKPTEANVMQIINKGSDAGMPAFGDMLSDQEKADILAYLKTL